MQSALDLRVDLLLRCLHEAQDPALYQFVADQMQEHEFLFSLSMSPIAYHSLGRLLPLVSPTTATLQYCDVHSTILLSKGLQKGWDECHKPKGGLAINLNRVLSPHLQELLYLPAFNQQPLRTQDDVQAITQLLSVCGLYHLHLDLSVRPPLTWQVLLKSVAEELKDNCSLSSFEVLAWPGNTDCLVGSELRTSLEHNHTLETLNLDFSSSTVHIDVVSIARGLTANTALKHLQLHKLQFAEHEVESLTQMLASNVTLRTLDLSGNGISSCGAKLLAQVLAQDNKSLARLDLTQSDISDAGAEHLADMLTTNTSLECLNLCDNNITSGVSRLAEALKHNSTLKVLRLDGNALFDGLECLASALTVNTTVTITQNEQLQWNLPPPPPGLTEILMANGVLQQLLTIAIEKTAKEFGEQLTSVTQTVTCFL